MTDSSFTAFMKAHRLLKVQCDFIPSIKILGLLQAVIEHCATVIRMQQATTPQTLTGCHLLAPTTKRKKNKNTLTAIKKENLPRMSRLLLVICGIISLNRHQWGF